MEVVLMEHSFFLRGNDTRQKSLDQRCSCGQVFLMSRQVHKKYANANGTFLLLFTFSRVGDIVFRNPDMHVVV